MVPEFGAVVVGLRRTLEEALRRSDPADFSVAVLDFRLGTETVSPVARRLVDQGVPFLFYTGQAHHEPGLGERRDCFVGAGYEKPSLLSRFEFIFTPKHGSWLNLVEGFFSKLARSVCAISASQPKRNSGTSWPPWITSIATPSSTLGPIGSTKLPELIRIWKSMN